MIVTLVQFQMPADTTVADAAAIFRSTAPRYLGMPDLVRKYYVFDSETRRAGGCYLMRNREAAERVFDENWRKVVAEKYGTAPEVTFFEAPVTVDNVTHEIFVTADSVNAASEKSPTVAYTLVGAGPERVIVLHDWTSTSESYAALHDLVDRDRFTYCFMDHRGYGHSRAIAGEHTTREAAADVVALADALGWEQFHLIGHSMSGQIAQRVTHDYKDRVKSLIAVTPVPACGVPIDEATREMFKGAAQNDGNWRTIAKMLTDDRLSETWYDAKLASFRQTIDPSAFLEFLDMWTREDFASDLGVVETPALIVTGGHDMEVFREASMRDLVGKHYPNAKFETLADSGHYPMAEAPIRFVRVIEDFVAACSTER